MCYYVLQETVCGVSGCGRIFLAIVYRGMCDDPQEPGASTELCRGGNAFWHWVQGSFSSKDVRPQGCCPSCLGPEHADLIPSKVDIKTAPKIEDWPQGNHEQEDRWVLQVPSKVSTGNDLARFARHKLAYQKACFGGLPGMACIWLDQIDQVEVDHEAERIQQSMLTHDFVEKVKEDEPLCPILAQIDEMIALFEPSQPRPADQVDAESIDEDMVLLSNDTPSVQ